MKKSARKINATTQRFTQIDDIIDQVVLLSGGQACLVMEIIATNFALQSLDEQQSRIYSYASFLNSLSFPIQIVVLSRKLDVSSYIKQLEEQARTTTNPALSSQITTYKDFVSELVKVNTVLDKKFFIVLSFSYLEKGAAAAVPSKDKHAFATDARNILMSKSTSVAQELIRVGLKSKILQRNELISLFHEIYNGEEVTLDFSNTSDGVLVGGAK